jgi:hypothetical protein
MIDIGDAYEQAHPGAYLYTEDYTFPCSEFAIIDLIARDPVTGKEKIIDSQFDTRFMLASALYPHSGNYWGWGYDAYWNQYPWQWAVCHAGSWIRWQHHYVWVAGQQRHHRCPVFWVKNGHTVGFVPIHPHDRPGRTPLNLKHGIVSVTDKKSGAFGRVDVDSTRRVKLLDQPPREFRKPTLQALTRVEPPHAMAHSAYAMGAIEHSTLLTKQQVPGAASPARSFVRAERDAPIEFNRKQQAFVIENQGSHHAPVVFAGRPEAFQQRQAASSSGSAVRSGGNPVAWGGSSTGAQSTAASNSGGATSFQPSAPAPSYDGGSRGGGGFSPGPSSIGGGGSGAPSPAPSTSSGGKGNSSVGSQ